MDEKEKKYGPNWKKFGAFLAVGLLAFLAYNFMSSVDMLEEKATMVVLYHPERGWEEVMLLDYEEGDLLYEKMHVNGEDYLTSPPCTTAEPTAMEQVVTDINGDTVAYYRAEQREVYSE